MMLHVFRVQILDYTFTDGILKIQLILCKMSQMFIYVYLCLMETSRKWNRNAHNILKMFYRYSSSITYSLQAHVAMSHFKTISSAAKGARRLDTTVVRAQPLGMYSRVKV